MNNVPTGAAPSRADMYFVYSPMLDLIGLTEGTEKGDGYNETVAYGAYTGGNVELVSMTLKELDVSPDEDAPESEEQIELVGSRPVSNRPHDGAQQPQEAAGDIRKPGG